MSIDVEIAKKSRSRDFLADKSKFKINHNNVDSDAFENAINTISLATCKDVVVFTKKKVNSKIKFVQVIQDNWDFALSTKFFTDAEILFLIRIQPFLQFKSNCIVDNIHIRNSLPMTQNDIAIRLNMNKSNISKVVNGLVSKGVIVKANGREILNNNTRTFALFINPNIFFCGDRENIEATLRMLFINTKSIFKDFPISLF